MNILKRAYCRIYQGIFKLLIPVLPYREPKILKTDEDVVGVLKENKISRVLLITDRGIRGLNLTKSLEDVIKENKIGLFVFDETVPNPTTKTVDAALKMYKENDCQGLIAFGGGSCIDCAKGVGALLARPNKTLAQMKGVLKVRKKLPLLIAVPTTAGTGSETTLAAVIVDSETRHKYAINDFPLIPKYALLKPEVTVGLPKHITATTGMDALTHAVEAYIGRSSTNQTRKCSLSAIKAIFENLPEAYNNGKNIQAREKLLKAAYDAGLAFTKSYVGYVHAIAHALGGKYNVPHGLANAVILPYVLKSYNKKIHKKLWEIGLYAKLFDKTVSKADGAKLFIEKIEDMNKKLNIPTTIEEIKQEDIEGLAKTAEKEANPLYPVPVLMTAKEIEKIFYQVAGLYEFETDK